MNRSKATLLLALCMACALLLSSCHANNDLWPASSTGATGQTEATVSAAPDGAPAEATDALEPSPTPVTTVAPGVNG